MTDDNNFEVIIVGGNYAGLSAAMALGRSLRKVLVIDDGNPCNAPTPHSHNFITQDGKTPKEIATLAREQVEQYETVHFYKGLAIQGRKTNSGFAVQTESGVSFQTKKLIFATGIKDIIPDIPGFAACWGKSVIHCPYCHGYEFRQHATGILAHGEAALHYAQLICRLTPNLTIFTQGQADFTVEQREKLTRKQIRIIPTPVVKLKHNKGQIQEVLLENGSAIALDALYARVPFEQHSEIPKSLGCEFSEQGFIAIDSFQQSSVPGLFACGDNSSKMRSVANAVSTGNTAGAMVNNALAEEEF